MKNHSHLDWTGLFIVLVIALWIGSLFLFTTAVASDFNSNYERIPLVHKAPSQVASWELTPTVIVCEHAPVTQRQITKAVNFWKGLGYRFYSTQYKHDPMNKCLMDEPAGYIVIHMVTAGVPMEEKALAQTHFYVDNIKNKILYAKIYMRSDVRETVLEHEMGHALGFLHFNKINHLMNEKWMMGGWDTEGLERRQ
tara:strand:- start:4 stop:591 length:588 start_codon:yes stop_codon:yes gene_type:complete